MLKEQAVPGHHRLGIIARSRAPSIVRLVASSLVLSAGACAGESGDQLVWKGTREQVNGVAVLRNPDSPLLDSARARVEQLWITPATDSEDRNNIWEDASALAVAGDSVYVLDRGASRIYAVRVSDGHQVGAWGRKGQGPGEFVRPSDIMTLGGAVAVLDGGKGNIERYGTDGSLRQPIRLPGVTFTARPLDSARLAVSGARGVQLLRTDGSAQAIELTPPVALADGPPQQCRRLGTLGAAIVRLSCITPHMQVIDTLGRTVREIVLPIDPLRTPDTLLDRFTTDARRSIASLNAGIPASELERQVAYTRESYRFSRRWREVRRDPSDGILALWEQSPDDLARGPATIHLLRPEGEWLASIPFTEGWRTFAIDGGRIFALSRDPDTDVARLVAYRLIVDER